MKKRSILDKLEKVGNRLPHPIYIFMILSVVVIIFSAIFSGKSFSILEENYVVKNLLSPAGIRWFFENLTYNFQIFPPLSMVIVMMIGLSVAEESGLIKTFLKKAIVRVKSKKFITFVVVFVGVLGNIAGSSTFAIIPPLGAIIFKAMKRNPIAGIIAGFSGVAAGLSANILITPTDVLLSSITNKAIDIAGISGNINPASNWYFMIASSFLLSIVGALVIDKFVEPRLNKEILMNDIGDEEPPISKLENKGLLRVLIGTIIYFIFIGILIFPNKGILRDPKLNTIIPSPFLNGMITVLVIWFLIIGIIYGKTVGSISKLSDIEEIMSDSVKKFSGFIVLCFFAAQFVEIFKYSNLGMLFSLWGSEKLQNSGLVGVPLIIMFILLVTMINFFIGSSSAKWAILAPIFIPMFIRLGIAPELTQASYRIADSVTNCISPLEPFMPFIIILCKKYDKDIGLGTIISIMLPVAITFLIVWSIFLIIWYKLGIPIGI